ncbi:MAG: Isoleucyl-tRNA synthetase, partial [Chthonomonadales bacterium]|nr:Isoleucyl-tRNA synthetase [Chthonomonadales bacterium]
GENLLKQVGEMYRRIRNTFRFLLNNLYDFDPATDAVPDTLMLELDRWAVAQVDRVVQTATVSYERYEYHKVYQATLNFCATELSSFYLDVLKDRLYASAKNSPERRSAQTAMHRIAETLARLLAPILVHTTEEVWDYLKLPNKPESVHLADFPTAATVDTDVLARWEPVLAARETVKKALEEARQAATIGNPLEAAITLTADATTYAALLPFLEQLPSLFLVSQASLQEDGTESGLTVTVSAAQGSKCPRCWLFKTDIGTNVAHPDLCARCADALG